MQKHFDVTGMTCEHCENRVSREVGEVPGILTAVADSSAGRLTVTSAGALDEAAIAAAVEEAGYTLVHD